MRTDTAPHRKGVGPPRTRALGWVMPADGRPRWILGAALVAVTALITLATHGGGATGGFTADNEMLYVWVCLVAFLFLPLPAALFEFAVVGAAYSWLLVDEGVPGDEIAARLAATLGSLLIAGILIARLRDSLAATVGELTERARVDSLTGLLNRRALIERAALEFARSRRSGTPVAMLLIDVDDFKSLNDRHGHVAGDHALRRVAHAISGETREIDAVARLGGDEFAVLLPGADGEGRRIGRQAAARRDRGPGRRRRDARPLGLGGSRRRAARRSPAREPLARRRPRDVRGEAPRRRTGGAGERGPLGTRLAAADHGAGRSRCGTMTRCRRRAS